jgi:hypothetical protein
MYVTNLTPGSDNPRRGCVSQGEAPARAGAGVTTRGGWVWGVYGVCSVCSVCSVCRFYGVGAGSIIVACR